MNETGTQGPAGTTGSCWDLAIAAAAHHAGGGRLSPHEAHHEIFQVSTMSALVEGILDGDTPYRELMLHGDFGLGTFNGLDGEMAAVDGAFFHMYGDGSIKPVNPDDLTPFAAVTFFSGDAEVDVAEPQTRDELLAAVDATVPSENLFYAIRIDGTFSYVTTRTAVRQERPYPSLLEATGGQVENRFDNVKGTIVGFRAPHYAQGMTVAGYHLHFLDSDRARGGHVLDFVIESGSVLVDEDTDVHLEMPTSPMFLDTHIDTETEDVARQVEAAENAPRVGVPPPAAHAGPVDDDLV